MEKIGLVFSGIGTQWNGMGTALLDADPVFRDAVDAVDALWCAQQGWSVRAAMRGVPDDVLVLPHIAHPAIFALQYGLTRCLLERGVRPVAVLGHSAGEVAAAVCAGALSLADAVRLVAAHSDLIRQVAAGAMLHVVLDGASLQRRLAATDGAIELAVINAERAQVVAGPAAAIAAFDAALRADGIDTRVLHVKAPLHTRAVEPYLARFGAALEMLQPCAAAIPIYSSLRGALAGAGDFDGVYWARHIRAPVRFADAARAMFAAGITRCIEVSPHPALLQHLVALADGRALMLEATLQRGCGVPVWPDAQQAQAEVPDAEVLATWVRNACVKVLGAEADIRMEASWPELGFSSLALAQFVTVLSELLGRRVPVTFPYLHASPAALCAALSQAPQPMLQSPSPERLDSPIAIVGMACRLPGGANDPAALWQLLVDGVDAITEIPAARWPAAAYFDADRTAPGRGVSRWGGFIAGQDLRDFDARHFRIAPREASALDPQQRLLLEVSWEALENAGFDPAALKGRAVGVYMALSTDDHKNGALYGNLGALDPYSGAGAMDCTAAGRLSYFFGFEGPNLALDTACSGSLVALHLACQALRSGDCDIALVGGVNAMLTPHLHVYFSKAGIMSPTGRCHVFDAAADGYVRAEGCAVLVLQREPEALRDGARGRRVRARVLGTAVNQDGASSGFSAPSGAAQQKVLTRAWQDAGVTGADIGYLEAHGTGTPIGDPIELEAMAAALAGRRSIDDPVPVGSLKSNLGHLEAAAGAGALIKTVLALEHATLPGNLHFTQPNARVDWAGLPLRVVGRTQPFAARGGRRIAGISGFGLGGTNAHAVLEASLPAPESRPRARQVLVLGAYDADDLADCVRQYAARIDGLDAAQLAALASRSNAARAWLPLRAAFAAPAGELGAALQCWQGGGADAAHAWRGEGACGPLVFAFTGQGCQYPGMARALYRSEPVYRAVLDRCALALGAAGGRMLDAMLDPDADPALLAATEVAQPAIFALQCAQVALLGAWGMRPARVVGHSVGEFAAAVAAGVLGLEAALGLVARRGACMGAAPPGGAMAALQIDPVAAQQAIGELDDRVALAAINGARSVVLSGQAQALDLVLGRLGPQGVRAKRLAVSHAYHSPLMREAAGRFAEHPAPMAAPGAVPWISSVDGRDLSGEGPDIGYWRGQITAPVRFDDAITQLEAGGCRTFVEIGPAAVLTQLGRARAGAQTWIALQERQGSVGGIDAAVAQLAAAGVALDWHAYDNPALHPAADLPPFPYQRRRHWRELTSAAPSSVHPNQQESSMAPTSPVATQPTPDATPRIRDLVAQLTGMTSAEIDPATSLLDLGLDSLMLVQLKSMLAAQLGIEVDMADFYGDLDSITRLAALAPAVAPPAVPTATYVAPAPSLPPGSPELPRTELAQLMALQLDTLARVIGEQNALLGRAPTPQPPPAPPPPPRQQASIPNFRSLTLNADALEPAQQAFVDDLARRYAARTPSSKALADGSRHVLADWKNTLSFRYALKEMMYPIVAASSRGARFIDIDGNEFLDFTMGCGIGLLGHAPPAVTAALHAQVDAGFAIGPQTPLAAEVAERIARLTGMERVTFCNTGAEAVMMAVRIARAVTKRSKLVIFSGAYHGTWDGVLGVPGESGVHPVDGGIPQGMVDELVMLNYGTEEALTALTEIAGDVAAVLVEPVQSRRPGLQPAAFLRRLREITAASGSALIFDEVITGFRILPGGAQDYFGVRADLATYGKVAGGGMPLSAVAGSARFMDAVDGGPWRYGDASKPEHAMIYFGGTYVKHPLALAAANAALIQIEGFGAAGYAALNARTTRMADTLNAWFASVGAPLTVTHFGSLFRIDGTGRYSGMMQPIELDLLFLLLNLSGLYIWERRICFLSFAHDDADVDRLVAQVQAAVRELRGAGFALYAGPGAAAPAPLAVPLAAPASSVQRRMYALAAIDGPGVVYNVPLALRMRGSLDVARLGGALRALVARHPALRTRFVVEGDTLLQTVEPDLSFTLARLSATPARLADTLDAFVQPFDLASAPLFRAALIELGADDHVLAMDAAHIVVDGLSLNVLARELMAGYDGETVAQDSATPAEFAAAERAYLASDACRADAAFWRAQFDSVPDPLRLPLDYPRPPQRRHRGADLFARLDRVATGRLTAAARAQRLPLYPLLLTLYAVLLQRLGGDDDLVIGVPVGGRTEPRFRNTVGMFAATLPLRLRAQPDATLGAYARACHGAFLAALAHQAYPLDALIGALELPRDTSRNPLFDTMFIYENGNDRVYQMTGLACSPVELSRHAAMFDLSMEVIEEQGELALRCEYDTDLFTQAGAQGILELYLRLLRLAPAMLEQSVEALPLVDARQQARLLAWGDGGPAPAAGTLAQAFDVWLSKTPDAAAIVCDGVTTSYRELDRMAQGVAAALRTEGLLAPGIPVALQAPRGAPLVAGMLGIMRAGAPYLPLDPALPAARVGNLLAATDCRQVLTAERLAAAAQQTPDGADAAAGPDDPAYIIFTSGSTGEPKGVVISQRNAAAFCAGLPQTFGFAPGQRILAATTVGFDIAALELLGALCCGMTVVLATDAQARDSAALLALAAAERVDVIQATPTRLRSMLEGAGPALGGARTVLVGGEALPQTLAERLLALSDVRAFNVYGPTETTIWSSSWPIAPGLVSLGRALPGERLLVLSPQRRLQPVGAMGELAIAGAGVGQGYLNDPERSAQRFVALPDVDGPVYLTGDLARWRHDGSLEYLGRRDDQVKLRGVRIEIGEVEHHLRALPGVLDAAAALRRNVLGEMELVGYLTGVTGDLDHAALRNALADKLPQPMIPARFVALAALPRNAAGKTDRRALPAPPPPLPVVRRAPRGSAETLLTRVFSEVLGREIGPDDDFFLAGGESLRALSLGGRARTAGFAFDLPDLYRWPTPAGLAANLVQAPPPTPATAAGALSGLADDELSDLLG